MNKQEKKRKKEEEEEEKGEKKNMTYDMMTCEMNNLETEWSLCSALKLFFVADWAQSTD